MSKRKPTTRKPVDVRAAMSEDAVQEAVFVNIDTLGVPGLLAWAIPNGGKRNKREAAKFKKTGTKAGCPDIHLFHNGQLYMLELKKAKGGTVSAAQKQFMLAAEDQGALVAVARGLDEALHILREWGLLRSTVTFLRDQDDRTERKAA